ncbi:uncharacterized protein [Halyomorpha halys]|uniref:uncharacterized protein n=1 Tax=Halyomorpha halys TaxID=286706 RepID=UPI0034D33BFA
MVQIQGGLSERFTSQTGIRQGDSLACLLFNIGLEKAIRESKVQTSRTIINHMVQILEYAYDIDIIGRSNAVVEKVLLVLDDTARKLGLVVDTNKTKYMIAGQKRGFNEGFFQIAHYSFE